MLQHQRYSVLWPLQSCCSSRMLWCSLYSRRPMVVPKVSSKVNKELLILHFIKCLLLDDWVLTSLVKKIDHTLKDLNRIYVRTWVFNDEKNVLGPCFIKFLAILYWFCLHLFVTEFFYISALLDQWNVAFVLIAEEPLNKPMMVVGLTLCVDFGFPKSDLPTLCFWNL